ncbi:MAG: DUF6132 family protein [Petrimonas sp.]|jgi:xanthine/uracil permease|uniref:DUF6132 family protein n=1 Tax=Petrimonas sp. TaxID=2023866 RepID=UPI002B3E66B5|nr:DUF6132 family protein [Petrimonas sp.]MEA4997011.1 DUF6132 family protein [Petrimonas sp.]MEA5044427.1 DUF6132 family protein [Petrimonas sp.]HMM17209.1 DUF6132 family protein [Petrimonas sp.]
MKNFFTRHGLKVAGVIVGSLGGYLYYYFVGCGTGSCPITSNPWRMTIYGAVLGLLIFDIFKKEEGRNKEIKDSK